MVEIVYGKKVFEKWIKGQESKGNIKIQSKNSKKKNIPHIIKEEPLEINTSKIWDVNLKSFKEVKNKCKRREILKIGPNYGIVDSIEKGDIRIWARTGHGLYSHAGKLCIRKIYLQEKNIYGDICKKDEGGGYTDNENLINIIENFYKNKLEATIS